MNGHLWPTDGRQPIALVTGGSRGIGRAVALHLARAGAKVVVTSRCAARAASVAEEMRAAGLSVFGETLDLMDAASVARIVPRVVRRHGGLDVLVNNAVSRTLPQWAPHLPQADDAMAAELVANIGGPSRLCHAARAHLRASGGAIVNVGSAITQRHVSGLLLYAVVKGAIRQLTRGLAAEWGPEGIRVNCVSPGFTRGDSLADTGMSAQDIDARFDALARFSALRTHGWPDDIAGLICWLASPRARFVTGADFLVDGGLSVQPIDAGYETAPIPGPRAGR